MSNATNTPATTTYIVRLDRSQAATHTGDEYAAIGAWGEPESEDLETWATLTVRPGAEERAEALMDADDRVTGYEVSMVERVVATAAGATLERVAIRGRRPSWVVTTPRGPLSFRTRRVAMRVLADIGRGVWGYLPPPAWGCDTIPT